VSVPELEVADVAVDALPRRLEPFLLLRPGTRVLDVGAGTTALARTLALWGHEVTVAVGSKDLVWRLEEQFHGEVAGPVADRVAWVHATLEEPLYELPVNWFGIALCRKAAVASSRLTEVELIERLLEPLEAGAILLIELPPDEDGASNRGTAAGRLGDAAAALGFVPIEADGPFFALQNTPSMHARS
jgi:hypothetical protein